VGDDNKQIVENGFDLHELATSNSRVGRVRQTITSDQLVSEIDLEVGVAPGIPLKVKGTVVTSASLKVVSQEKWQLQVENTKVKGSNIPIFNQIMENDLHLELPVGDFYNTIQGNVPVIPMTVSEETRPCCFVCTALALFFTDNAVSCKTGKRHSMLTKVCALQEILTITFLCFRELNIH
jgi:hypothetical protein